MLSLYHSLSNSDEHSTSTSSLVKPQYSNPEPIIIASIKNPISFYGKTKLMAEKYIIKNFKKKKIPFCIERIFSTTNKNQKKNVENNFKKTENLGKNELAETARQRLSNANKKP